MKCLQFFRTHWRGFAFLIVLASVAIVIVRSTLPSWLFSDQWPSPKWRTNSGHDSKICKLHVVNDTLVSVGIDGVIALHNKATLEVISRVETRREITSSTVFPEGHCVILGYVDGNISIVRLNQSAPFLDAKVLRGVSSSVRAESLFKSRIDAIAIENTTSSPTITVCSDGKVHLGQINLDDNTILAIKEIPELRYGGSSISVVSPEPNTFVFAAEFFQDLKVIRLTGSVYSVSDIKSSGSNLPRYSGIVISSSGKFACTLSWRGKVSCSDLETTRELWTRQGYFPGHLREAFWISDSEIVTFAGWGSFTLPPGFTKWNAGSGSIIGRWQFTGEDSVSCIAAYPDSSRVVIGTTNGLIGEISLEEIKGVRVCRDKTGLE